MQQLTNRREIIVSHTGIAYHDEHNVEGMPRHYSFSLLINVEFACEV